MKLMDNFKKFLNINEEDEYEDDTDFAGNYVDEREDTYEDDSREISSYSSRQKDREASKDASAQRNKYVNIHATTQLQVVLVKPESFQDATSIADHLNNKRTVVLNLESTNKEVSRRLVDFLSGVAYANRGNLKRVANSTFIITPFNVDIMGDLLLDELENSGLYI